MWATAATCLCEDCRDSDCACGARRVFTPRVPCALLELASHKTRAPAGAPLLDEAPAPERALSDESPYVHFGVGCDGCGAFPIRGAAFRCLDCPDAVGFDLCAECRSSSLVVTGRFDQGHTSNHRVVEREQVRTWLHELQAANPQLGVHEVLTSRGCSSKPPRRRRPTTRRPTTSPFPATGRATRRGPPSSPLLSFCAQIVRSFALLLAGLA